MLLALLLLGVTSRLDVPCAGQARKAQAILAGRYHVDFADVKSMAHSVLRHRLVLNFHARADNVDSDQLVSRLLEAIPTEEKRK